MRQHKAFYEAGETTGNGDCRKIARPFKNVNVRHTFSEFNKTDIICS